MQRGHKIRLKPNQEQTIALRKAVGTARYVYNWALETWKRQYDDYKNGKAERPDVYSICRRWTRERPEWSKEIARGLQTQAILNLGKAMINFWKRGTGFPSFKKKSDRGSFQVDCVKGHVDNRHIHLPNIGDVRMLEDVRFKGKHLGYTISCCAGKWYVSVAVDLEDTVPVTSSVSVVGVDVGIKNIAVASDGTVLENPRYLIRAQRRLKHYQRQLSRQVNGSHRRERTKHRIACLHQHVANQRLDAVHKFTSQLSKNHGVAVIEDLDVSTMGKDKPWIRQGLQDTCMREVHRQLGYKMKSLEKAPRFYPSSRTCSACGDVKSALPPDIRTYKCGCGVEIDRDLNAAINLRNRCWVTASSRVECSKGAVKRGTKTRRRQST